MFEAVELLKQGGWPIVFLGLCSLAGLTVVIERIVALRRSHVFDPRVLRALEDYEDERSADRTMAACQRAHGPFARLIEEILRSRHLGRSRWSTCARRAARRWIGSSGA